MKRYLWILLILIVLSLASGCSMTLNETSMETSGITNIDEGTRLDVSFQYPAYYADVDFQLSKVEISENDGNAAYYELNVYTKTGAFYCFEDLTVQIDDFIRVTHIGRKTASTEGDAECRYKIMIPSNIAESDLMQNGRLVFSNPYNFKQDFDRVNSGNDH